MPRKVIWARGIRSLKYHQLRSKNWAIICKERPNRMDVEAITSRRLLTLKIVELGCAQKRKIYRKQPKKKLTHSLSVCTLHSCITLYDAYKEREIPTLQGPITRERLRRIQEEFHKDMITIKAKEEGYGGNYREQGRSSHSSKEDEERRKR
ncbi:hypothetical protein CR513_24853, partial [Mucuna pruriens]